MNNVCKSPGRAEQKLRLVFVLVLVSAFGSCGRPNTFMRGDADAIHLVRAIPGVSALENREPNYDWQVIMWCSHRHKCPRVSGKEDPKFYPIRVACYCRSDAKVPVGWFFEINLATHFARAISGNKKLEKDYGFDEHVSRMDKNAIENEE